MTETGNPSISRGPAPCFYSSTSSSVVKMVEVVLFEVKQHKYKLVLGWVTVPWVVLLIDRSRISQEPNAGTLLCYDHDLSLIPGIWWYCILDGHPWWIHLHDNCSFSYKSLLHFPAKFQPIPPELWPIILLFPSKLQAWSNGEMLGFLSTYTIQKIVWEWRVL